MYESKKGPAAAEPLERETLGEQGLAKRDFGEQKEQNNSGEQGLAKKDFRRASSQQDVAVVSSLLHPVIC